MEPKVGDLLTYYSGSDRYGHIVVSVSTDKKGKVNACVVAPYDEQTKKAIDDKGTLKLVKLRSGRWEFEYKRRNPQTNKKTWSTFSWGSANTYLDPHF